MTGGFLPLMVLSRASGATAFMTYPASLPFLLETWGMSGADAGSVQSAFNLAYAVSLLAFSWVADRLGPERVFGAANWAAAFLMAGCAVFAESRESALVWFPLLAFALGGSYTPALMLVAARVPAERRGKAVGWVLAGASIGYFVTVALVPVLIPPLGYQNAWMILAAGPAVAAGAGTLALRRSSGPALAVGAQAPPATDLRAALTSRRSLLLTGGYTAHCWELLGMWAWAPAFLTLSLAASAAAAPVVFAILVAAALHLSGAFGTVAGGSASDRFGRRRVLMAMAAAGGALSLVFGWSAGLGPILLLAVAALYGFSTLGDSGVLSTAMTEAVDPAHLGSAFAFRSILGFGAGALSPIVFGLVLDLTNEAGAPPQNWGWAFASLGVGGLAALAFAWKLPRDRERPSEPA